ncbi:MAG: hypothetical protein SNJ78_08395 [Spirochaetales bacterium]
METTILIAGTAGELYTELLNQSLSRQYNIAAALDPEAEHPVIEEDWAEMLQYFRWNKSSALSAKNLLLEVFSVVSELKEVFLIYQPPEDGRPLHEIPVVETERVLDHWVKGYLFFVKELLLHFQRRKKGILTFILQESYPSLSPLGLSTSAFFKGLGSALFNHYQNEPFALRGFHSQTSDIKDFISHLFSLEQRVDKTLGKWNKYSGKSSFWSFGRS